MRLLPQKTAFFDLFDAHADILVEMATEVRDMLERFDALAERQERIRELEHRGDQITHEVATEMHASFITPLDKEDIAAMASGLDDVADYAEAASDRVVLYQLPASTPEARDLAELLLQAVSVVRDAVRCVRTLRERDRILGACRDIHRLENESDVVYRRALGNLFNTPGADPLTVLKWKEVYERLEMAVDKCEDVSNVVESILLKYA